MKIVYECINLYYSIKKNRLVSQLTCQNNLLNKINKIHQNALTIPKEYDLQLLYIIIINNFNTKFKIKRDKFIVYPFLHQQKFLCHHS